MTRMIAVISAVFVCATIAKGAQRNDIDALYRSGAAALAQDRPFEAIEILNRVAARDPSYQDIQLLLGQSCYLAGLTRPAKQHLERALEMNPRDPQAALLLGLLLHEEQRHVEAVEALELAYSFDPQSPYASIYRGLSLLKLGRAQQARVDIERAVRLAPQLPEAGLALAELELAEGSFGKAERLLRELVTRAPANTDAKILLGRTLFDAGKPAEAVPILRAALETTPNHTEALYLLSQALLRSGDQQGGRVALARFQEQRATDEQIRVLESALADDRDDTASRLQLARLLLEQGLPNRALPHVAVLMELIPSDPRVLELAEKLEQGGPPVR